MSYVSMNVRVNGYTSQVLGIVKEKYGLKDKGQALDKFMQMHGDEYLDKEIKEEMVREVIRSCDAHIKKYGFKRTSLEELRKICGA